MPRRRWPLRIGAVTAGLLVGVLASTAVNAAPSMASQPDGAAFTAVDARTPTSSPAVTAPIRKGQRLRGIRLSTNRARAAYLWGPGHERPLVQMVDWRSVAERERFELSRPLRAYGISSAAPSTELGDRSAPNSSNDRRVAKFGRPLVANTR